MSKRRLTGVSGGMAVRAVPRSVDVLVLVSGCKRESPSQLRGPRDPMGGSQAELLQ